MLNYKFLHTVNSFDVIESIVTEEYLLDLDNIFDKFDEKPNIEVKVVKYSTTHNYKSFKNCKTIRDVLDQTFKKCLNLIKATVI